MAALFSCSNQERAFESDKLKHGVFFHYVLEGLRGKAKDADGEVTWDGLQLYVRRRVTRDVGKLIGGGVRQTPALNAGELAGESPVLLAGVAAGGGGESAPVPPAPAAGGRELTSKATGMTFVRVPKGTFTMGSREGEEIRSKDEEPHEVTLTRDFYLGRYEVTRGEFAQFVRDANYKTEAEADGKGGYGLVDGSWKQDPSITWRNPGFAQTDRHPVVVVSWNDAVAFCRWLSGKDGRPYRLPTEAEWEYACRAGTATPFSFGGRLNGAEANCNGDHPYGTETKGPYRKGTCAVDGGDYPANKFGLSHMHGNVWEWCEDYYGPYAGLPSRDPVQSNKQSEDRRVLRGGSWNRFARNCRAAVRSWGAPGSRDGSSGFRVVFRLD